MDELTNRSDRTKAVRAQSPARLTLLAAMAVAAAMLVLAASAAHAASQKAAAVSVRTTALGRVLVDSRGHTLYLFEKDKHGKSACNGSCAKFWPPLLGHGKPVGSGLKPAMLGTIQRADGGLQVTYNGHPLYTYSLDQSAGQTNGEGMSAFGARWYAVSARGTAVTKPAASPGTTTTSGYPPPPKY